MSRTLSTSGISQKSSPRLTSRINNATITFKSNTYKDETIEIAFLFLNTQWLSRLSFKILKLKKISIHFLLVKSDAKLQRNLRLSNLIVTK